MTTTLLPALLETAARNHGRGNTDLALFEIATVTLPQPGMAAPILPVDRRPTDGEWDDLQKALPDQPLHLGLVLTGAREPSGWWGAGQPVSWSDALEGVRQVAEALGLTVDVRAGRQAPWHPGRCGQIVLTDHTGSDRVLGHAGELCESVRLFDVYRGEQIGAGRKSLAFALRFRAPDRTLTEAETAAARDDAVALAAERHGAEQRA
jgi:phenylalanyl-tRNA synthetase beta chain